MKLLFLVMFVLVTLGIGIYSRYKIKNMNDFFLGSRNMGAWMSAFAYGTSYFSAVVFVGYAGKFGWGMGVSTIWIGIGNAIFGCMLAWIVLGKRTRDMTHRLSVSTMPEFFSERYGSKPMKILAAIIIFIFLVPYTASIFKGLGYLFESSFGISFSVVVLSMSALTGIYLILGGYLATAINDFVQGIIMIVGAVLMVLFVVNHPNVGGLQEGISRLVANGAAEGKDLGGLFGPTPMNLLALVLMTSFGTWGLPQMLHKFYAIKDDQAIRRGTWISTIFSLIIGVSAYFTGAFGRLFLPEGIPNGNADLIVPKMLEAALPDALIGLIIVLMLSASMSTLASLVLVSSSVVSIDFVKGFVKPNIRPNSQMTIMRLCCVLFVTLAYVMAIWQNATVVTLMALSWGVISGMFLAPYLFGLLWKGTTRMGAWAGFAAGALTMIIGITVELPKVGNVFGKVFVPGISCLAMLASVVAVPLVSVITKKLDTAIVIRAFGNEKESNDKAA